MKLRERLAWSHGIIIGLMCLVFPLALYAIHGLAGRMDALIADNMRAIESIESIVQQLDVEIAQLMQMMLKPQDVILAHGGDVQTPVRAAIDQARPFFETSAEHEAFADVERRYVHFENAIAIWHAGQMTQLSSDELPSDFKQLREAVVRLRTLKSASLVDATRAARYFAREQIALLGIVALLALLVGLLATLRQVNSITDPADQLAALVQRMSAGDFEIAYAGGSIDEFNALGRHLETMGKMLARFRATNLERLIVEQRRTDSVLDSIGVGLVIFSEEGRIERINPVAERQLGIESDRADGKRFEDIGDAKVGMRVREVLETGEFADAGDTEMLIERDGENRILDYSLHRFVDGEGGRPGAVLVMRDVTTQREFDKMRSEFVLRASHELRTPITSIRMGLGLLGETMQFPAGSRDAELYQTVQQELKRMVALLADLLDLSRLRSGEQAMERLPTGIEDVLAQARQRFTLAATDAGITVDLELESSLPRLSLCRSAFDRVLDNLIANALRYTPAGGSIMLSAHRTSAHVAIAVTDTGQGIPYAQQALIFQPFVQVGSKRGGAGLGLAICKEIVHQHGGEIHVSSMPRRGTTFTILLPA